LLFLNPTEKPDKSLLSTVADNIILKAFMTTTNNKGDKGSLSQAMRAIKEAVMSFVNQNKETHRRDTMSNPFTPFLPEATSPQAYTT
jgi:hypothetical protein